MIRLLHRHEIDVADLGINDALRISDVLVSPKIKIMDDADQVVVHVIAVKEEVAATPGAVATEGEAAPADAAPVSYDQEGKEYPGEPSEAEVGAQPESDEISMEQVLEQTASKGQKRPAAASASVEAGTDKVESHTV